MNILFITKEFPYPLNSGHRMRSWHYLAGLARAGRVVVLCYGKKDSIDAEGLRLLKGWGGGIELIEDVVEGKSTMAARMINLFSRLPCAVKVRVSLKMKARCAELITREKIDALVCDGAHLAVNVPFDAFCRKVLNEHNVESVLLERYKETESNFLKRAYIRSEWKKFMRFENQIWIKFDQIHVCSQNDKTLVKARSPKAMVEVIPNGVDCKPLVPLMNDAQREQRIIYSGLIGWQPNEDAVLYFAREIYPHLKSRLGQVRWSIVGKDPSVPVRELAGKDTSITVTGTVPDVRPYIEKSHVVVVPLRIGSGTRLKILEAMAMGRPVVSTTVGCEGLEVKHGEHILIADNPKEFAEQVARLFKDAALHERIITNAHKLVKEKYDWPIIEKQVAQCF